MIRYLDNNQNRKRSPNQNFARELMELFLLGVGNYTEADVEASTAAWTGHTDQWDDEVSPYRWRRDWHDAAPKDFLGRRINTDAARARGLATARDDLGRPRRGHRPRRCDERREPWPTDSRRCSGVPLPQAVDVVRHRHDASGRCDGRDAHCAHGDGLLGSPVGHGHADPRRTSTPMA